MGKNESSKIKRTPIREAVKLRLWGMAAGRCEILQQTAVFGFTLW